MRPAERARTLTLTRALTGTLTLTLTLTFALRRSLQDGDVASCYHLASPGFRRAAGSAQKFEEVVRENPEYAAAIASQPHSAMQRRCTPKEHYTAHAMYDIPLAAARFTFSPSTRLHAPPTRPAVLPPPAQVQAPRQVHALPRHLDAAGAPACNHRQTNLSP